MLTDSIEEMGRLRPMSTSCVHDSFATCYYICVVAVGMNSVDKNIVVTSKDMRKHTTGRGNPRTLVYSDISDNMFT